MLRIDERVYPFAWLGILAEAPSALHLASYAHHEHGFALADGEPARSPMRAGERPRILPTLLDAYSATCLNRAWKVTRFPWWMTSMLHRFPGADLFDARLQLAQLRHIVASRDAAADLAGNDVGLPFNT